MGNYPLGAKYDPEAPYNEYDLHNTKTVTVDVTVTKTMTVHMNLDDNDITHIVKDELKPWELTNITIYDDI